MGKTSRRSRACLAAVCSVLLALSSSLHAQQAYRVIDLYSSENGTGLNALDGSFHSSYGLAINNAGQAVGSATSVAGGTSGWSMGFTWSLGRMLSGGGTSGQTRAINDAGITAGWNEYRRSGNLLQPMRAYVGGYIGTFDIPSYSTGGDAQSYATAVNTAGHATGASQTSWGNTGPFFAFLYQDRGSKLLNLGTLPGGDASVGFGINDRDHVVGASTDASGRNRAFIYRDGEMHDLGTLGGQNSSARAINNAGQIVGAAQDAKGVSRAFIYENGVMRDLGTKPGSPSVARGINEHGQVVGTFEFERLQRPDGGTYAIDHCFLYEQGRIIDLSLLVPDLVSVSDINDRGQIVGSAIVTMKVYRAAPDELQDYRIEHAVILDPVIQPRLLNISTRAMTDNSERQLIAGFVVTGVDKKRVMIRGLGPSLAGSLSGAIVTDPRLELRSSTGELIASNDNWATSTSPRDPAVPDFTEAEVRATRIPPSFGREAAIIAVLEPGSYTALFGSTNTGAAAGLIEVYELDAAVNATLANISTRGWVGPRADEAMIAGVIVGADAGAAAPNLLARALGPSLTDEGVQGVLADPVMSVFDQNGTLIAENDDWQQGGTAIALPPVGDREAAVQGRLAPGAYTVVVSGNNGGSGVALVEIYQLP